MLKALFIPNYLDCNYLLSLVVEALKGLAETTTTKFLHNFVTITQMVLHNYLVVTTVVVISIIIHKCRRAFNLLRLVTNKIHLRILKDFYFFIVC